MFIFIISFILITISILAPYFYEMYKHREWIKKHEKIKLFKKWSDI